MLGPIEIDMALRGADENLYLRNSGVGDSYASLIADKLISCKAIKEVDLSGTTQETTNNKNNIRIINLLKKINLLTLA